MSSGTRLAVQLAVVGSLVACTSGSGDPATATSAFDLCAGFCPAYLACADGADAPSDVGAPLFCGHENAREASCESACRDNVAALGQDAPAFLDCGSCVLPRVGAEACDYDKVNDIGAVACSDSCSVDAGDAFDTFRRAFAVAMRGVDLTSCSAGTVEVAASDPRVEHVNGTAADDGSWSCTSRSGCNGYPFSEGPDLALPPGDFAIGFRDVSVASDSTFDVGELSVRDGDGKVLASVTYKDLSAFASGEISLPLHLTVLTQVSPAFNVPAANGIHVGRIFFVKH